MKKKVPQYRFIIHYQDVDIVNGKTKYARFTSTVMGAGTTHISITEDDANYWVFDADGTTVFEIPSKYHIRTEREEVAGKVCLLT